jgi:IS1 family transposase
MSSMNRLSAEDRVRVVKTLVEGNSLRATAGITGVARMTVEKLLRDLSAACIAYQDAHLRNLSARRVQCDEIWAFVGAKQKNVTPKTIERGAIGDVWTWVAMDADTKLAISWLVGDRGAASAYALMDDLASRLSHRIQLTTDGHKVYAEAVESAFWQGIDYAMLIKIYGADRDKAATYSPAQCMGTRTVDILGVPDPKHISTSYVERQNLTMRMSMRRFTRLTNGFSKKIENHAQAVALHFMYYNFVRIHQTLRITPAMAAGISAKVWEVEDLIALLDSN